MAGASSLAAFVTAMLFAGGALAAECPQSKAVYAAVTGSYSIRFHPVDDRAAAVTHLFEMQTGNTKLDGLVMDTEEPLRTAARIASHCPDGDVTGEDIRNCTAFEGYIYGIDEKGFVSNVPRGDSRAAHTLLFAGLGPALVTSVPGEKLKLLPVSDSFIFRECAP